MGEDSVTFIQRSQARDERYIIRGDASSGIANLRVRVSLDTPGMSIEFGGKEVAGRVAEMVRRRLVERLSHGQDAQGRSLPALKASTVRRRERRQRQFKGGYSRRGTRAQYFAQAWGRASKRAKAEGTHDKQSVLDRFRFRGRPRSGKTNYSPTDLKTPMHESGLAAENIDVRYKGRDSGDPVWLLSTPTGGKGRRLGEIDDGRGARQYAFQHYGFERLLDFPADMLGRGGVVDKTLDDHFEHVIALGGSILGAGRAIAKAAAQFEAAFATDDFEAD
jgi:hypothetical protein